DSMAPTHAQKADAGGEPGPPTLLAQNKPPSLRLTALPAGETPVQPPIRPLRPSTSSHHSSLVNKIIYLSYSSRENSLPDSHIRRRGRAHAEAAQDDPAACDCHRQQSRAQPCAQPARRARRDPYAWTSRTGGDRPLCPPYLSGGGEYRPGAYRRGHADRPGAAAQRTRPTADPVRDQPRRAADGRGGGRGRSHGDRDRK